MDNTFDKNSTFEELGIAPPILEALGEMGFEMPTEVQSRAIPHILGKKDVIVKSKTGSGKTAVFGVSMLQLTDPEAEGPQGLILTPTRELAVQVDNDIKQMASHLPHKTTAVYGQHSMNAELNALNKGVTIVTGTPGRVYDHIDHGNLKTKHIRFLVLDEADRMLDMGFIVQVEKIIRTLPKDRVTLLFSATIPDEIKHICTRYMKEPETIEIESETKTVDTIRQLYYRVEKNEKRTQLHRILMAERPESCMIFCNTRIAVDQVHSFLTRKGYACHALHGEIPQAKRINTIQQFKQGEFHLLVATDVAARGIHIDELSLVINYDVPVEKDSYVHRIGRTGRVGHEGRAISIVSVDDIMNLYAIEEHIGVLIEESELLTDEFLAEHKAKIDEWKKNNELKVSEEERPSRSKSGGRNQKGTRSRGTGGERGKKPRRDSPSDPKDKCSDRPAHADDRPRKKPADPGRVRESTGKDAGNIKPRGNRTADVAAQRNRPDNIPGRRHDDHTKRQPDRTGRPDTAADTKKAVSPDIPMKPAAADQTQKPAEKKGFLRRIAERLFGR
jgi:ATP-dependent RNA helicase DeaD